MVTEQEVKLEEWEEIKSDNSLWRPETKGEFIEGHVVEVRKGVYDMLEAVVQTPTGQKVTPSHAVLSNKIEAVRPTDVVRIIYVGEEKSNQGKMMKMYSIFRKPVANEEIHADESSL